MKDVLLQRPGESRIYDINCAGDLPDGAIITSVVSVAADTEGLSFGVPVINDEPVTYGYLHTAPAGTVIQVRIGNAQEVPFDKLFVIRARYNDSSGGQPREARVVLRVKD